MEVPGKKKKKAANKKTNIFCDPCDGNDETETAESYCIDCNDFLCKGCANAHRKSKLSRHHELLEGDKMPKKKLVLSSDNTCSLHDGKPLEYLCNNHGDICCSSCATLQHRSCKLLYLTKTAEGIEDTCHYGALTKRIQKVKQRISGTKDKIRVYQDRAKSNHLSFLEEIQEFRNNIETLVKAVEDNATEKVKVIKDKDEEELDSFSRRSDEIAEEIDDMKKELDLLSACKQNTRLCLSVKQVETKIDTIETKLSDIEAKAKVRRYKFRGSEIMRVNTESWGSLQLLEFDDVPTLSAELKKDKSKYGSLNDQKEANYETTVSVTKGKTDLVQVCGATARFEQVNRDRKQRNVHETAKSLDNDTPVHADQTSKTTVLKKIYIRHERDTNASGCLIAGMKKLTHSKLLLTDYNNQSLKIVDVTNRTIVSYLKLAYRPRDITLVGNDVAVVCCCDKLVFFRVNKDLIKTKEVNVKGQCSGVANLRKFLFVTFTSPRPCLKILNVEGTVLRIFPNNPWPDMFTSPNFVIPCANGKEIIVSDGERGLLTVKLDGSTNTHKEKILKTPLGMTPGRTGTIFVADRDSNTVIESSEPSQEQIKIKMRVILSEIESPLALVYNKFTERLYISHGCVVSDSNDSLSVFQL